MKAMCVAALCLVSSAALAASPTGGHNGVGPDPDGDGNPATVTRGFLRIGDAAEAAFDPPYRIITFDAPQGKPGASLTDTYAATLGVRFSPGLTRQVCGAQRDGDYSTACTYLRAPSGRVVGGYRDDWGDPLQVTFARPVCVAAAAIYPTGGKEGERFKVTLQPVAADKTLLAPAELTFAWTSDTYRWRLMAGVAMPNTPAKKLRVSVTSLDRPKEIIRFLIDDIAFVDTHCAAETKRLDAATAQNAGDEKSAATAGS